jgi:hypothetical protein
MKENLEMSNLSYNPVIDKSPLLEELISLPSLEPFGTTVVRFVDGFSKKMLATPSSRIYPELAALAFWLRKSSVEKIKKHTIVEKRIWLPRGIAFHVAPANVDTIFIYSWFLSLLCGNSNIVRISSKPSAQVRVIIDIIEQLFAEDEFIPVRDRSLIVQYGHDAEVNEQFSSVCDIRLVWGGDQTINAVRKAILPPMAVEMTFANKYSFAVINTEAINFLDEKQLKCLADAFYNDAYWFAQMACSSPRMIVWLGGDCESIHKAQDIFWLFLQKRMQGGASGLDMSDYVNKRVSVDSLALNEDIRIENGPSNDVSRVWLTKMKIHEELHCGAGLFFEASIRELKELLPILSRRIQTVSYYGISNEAWRKFLTKCQVSGIDRVVPIGKALDFDYVWDGYDMTRMLLREISVL